MSLVFRKPTTGDYVAIAEIHNAQSGPDHQHPPEAFRGWSEAPKGNVYVKRYIADLDGEVIAIGVCRDDWWGYTYPGRYWVNLYVRHDYHNRGVDTQMLHHVLRDLEPPAEEVWTVIREDFLEQAGFVVDEGFEVQGRTWGALLDLGAFDLHKFQDVQSRLEAEGVRFLPYGTLDDPYKHRKVQALHEEAKRDMPLFEPVATAEFDDVEDEATLPETVMVAVNSEDEMVGVSSIDPIGAGRCCTSASWR